MVFDCTTSKSKYFRDCIGFAILSYAMGPKISRHFPSCSFAFEGIRDEAATSVFASHQCGLGWNSRDDAIHMWVALRSSVFQGVFLLVFAGMSFANKRKRGQDV